MAVYAICVPKHQGATSVSFRVYNPVMSHPWKKFLSTCVIFDDVRSSYFFFNRTIIFLTHCIIFFFNHYFSSRRLHPPPSRFKVFFCYKNIEAYLLYFYLFVYMYLRAHARIPFFLYPRG